VTTTDLYGIEGQVLDGQFRVDRAIGEGGFSVVYRGLHIGLDEPVAIKCLKLQAPLASSVVDGIVRRFRDESKIHYRLSRGSLHIARTIAAGTTMAPATGALVPYMVLEWLEGFTLAEELRARRMRGEKGRSLQEVIRLLDPVADAMAFAHSQGVVHRDLNPSNIFVAHSQGSSKLKVLDFGVAKIISDALSLGPRMATIGQIRMFTPAYAAPEQFHDALGAIGSYTDVYSFAVMVVELLSDRTPIEGEHIGEYADRALDPVRRPTPRSMGVALGDAVEAVLARAVTVDPSQRPRDIGEFWGMLKNAATRDANQSRGVGEIGFPQPPVMTAPSARGADLSKVTAGGLPLPPEPLAPGLAAPPHEVVDLVPDTRGSGWRPQAGAAFANTVGPARAPSAPALDETREAEAGVRQGLPRKATLFQGSQAGGAAGGPRAAHPAATPLPPPHASASPLPPHPVVGGISSHTAFAATMATPGAPRPQASPPAPSLHLGDTAPSAVLRAAMPAGQAAKPAVRWYTPSLEGNTPFPATPVSLPTPPSAPEEVPKKPKTRRLIVIAMALTVALVLAAVLANYLSPQ
jgi:serine/threonine-protein kinase